MSSVNETTYFYSLVITIHLTKSDHYNRRILNKWRQKRWLNVHSALKLCHRLRARLSCMSLKLLLDLCFRYFADHPFVKIKVPSLFVIYGLRCSNNLKTPKCLLREKEAFWATAKRKNRWNIKSTQVYHPPSIRRGCPPPPSHSPPPHPPQTWSPW